MWKNYCGWGCAVVLMGLVEVERIAGQEAEQAAVTRPVQTSEQQIEAALRRRLTSPLQYEGEQLNTVLASIAEEYGISIVFDRAALDELAISPETEVTVSLRNVSLRSALNLMLKEPGLEDLCYIIDQEVLLITTVEKANETVSVEVYRVDDLLEDSTGRFNSAGSYGDVDSLIDLVVANIEHASWMENGTGEGEIAFYPPGMLVISQTRRIHDKVNDLFVSLRNTREQILADRKEESPPKRAITRGFAIEVELGEQPAEVQKRLSRQIQSSVDWNASAGENQEVWIDVLPKRVFVHHLPNVVEQVETVLDDMKILERTPPMRGGLGSRGGGFQGGGGGF